MDPTESQLRRRFLLEIEQAIRLSNREVIHERIPAISSDNILPFAVAVAKTRARYLEAAFKFANVDHSDNADSNAVGELKRHREVYEEARMAFEALHRAIEQGYVDLDY